MNKILESIVAVHTHTHTRIFFKREKRWYKMLVPPLKYYEELAAKKVTKERQILSNNFEEKEIEGTELDLENTAEAPIEILKIEGNTIQNGEPSLGNEVQVAGVTVDTEISLKNKNQLILADVEETTYYGVSYSCKNGKVELNGTSSQPIFIIIPLKKAIKVSKQFVWSAITNKILSAEKEVALWLSNETGSKLFNKDLWLEDTVDRVFTTTPTEETLITRIAFYVGSGFTFDNIEIETQLEYSEEVTKIVEGKEQIHAISLGNKVLYGDENSRDSFKVAIDQDFFEKNGYIKISKLDLVRKWGKFVYDGNINAFGGKSTTTANNVFHSTKLTKKILKKTDYEVVKTYCNYFKGNFTASQVSNADNVGIGIRSDGWVLFGFGLNSKINTIDSANQKLQELNAAGHPLYVIYQLAEPEIETITDTTLINQIENFINNAYTYKEKTSITSKLFLKLKYKKDKYYDLENRVKALEEANNG